MAWKDKNAKKFSDNAKSFVGANRKIKKIHEMIWKPEDQLAGYLAAEGIESGNLFHRDPLILVDW